MEINDSSCGAPTKIDGANENIMFPKEKATIKQTNESPRSFEKESIIGRIKFI